MYNACMAPRVKRKTKEADKDVSHHEALKEFGLHRGQVVKFLDHDSEVGLVRARAMYVERDGSIRLMEGIAEHGTGRSIPPERIRKLEIGPRGGQKWVPILEAD